MENVDGFHLLTGTDELDRLSDYRTDGESSTTTGIAVEFGKDDTIKVQTVVEFLSGVDGVLARHGVDNEQRLIRLDGLFE